jgi:hypothetical protein
MALSVSLACRHRSDDLQTVCPVCTGFLLGLIAAERVAEEERKLSSSSTSETRRRRFLVKSCGGTSGLGIPGGVLPRSSGTLLDLSDRDVRMRIFEWAKEQGIVLSFADAGTTDADRIAVDSRELEPGEDVVLLDLSVALSAVGERRAALPVSMPVGGIITPQ